MRRNEKETVQLCPICERELIPGVSSDEHHWVPRLKGGTKGPKSKVHRVCHDKIHSIWKESELAAVYNNPDTIRKAEEMKEFLRWISTKRPDFYTTTRMNRRKR